MNIRYFAWNALDKKDTLLLKGIAILFIVIHNFMHILPSTGENEFYFDANRVFALGELLLANPENSIRYLFSYFGHFGVQVFIFVSAYSFTKKSLTQDTQYFSFILNRLRC